VWVDHCIVNSRRFRERLLLCMPIMDVEDFRDPVKLISESPGLVSCVCYVTSKYVPGYEKIRETLTTPVLHFLESIFTAKRESKGQEMANMVALMVLYTFARASPAITNPSTTRSTKNINWLTIKTCCESYAFTINLHRSIDALKRQGKPQSTSGRVSTNMRQYLFWLWLYTESHL
jgi:hypothetical protein